MGMYTCENCQRMFKATASQNRKYCSRKCFFEASTAWNKGLTSATDERVATASSHKLKNVADKETLQVLYVEQNLPLKTIGKQFGVSGYVIKRLVAEFGLERIPKKRDEITPEIIFELYQAGHTFREIAQMYECSEAWVKELGRELIGRGRSHRNQAGVIPAIDELRRLYWDEWLGYEEIGDILKVDFTTIPYWLKKFDIPRRSNWETRRGKDWQPPDVDTIIHLYEAENIGMTSIGEMLGVSKAYIEKILADQDIEIRRSGYPNVSHYTAKDGHKVKSGLEIQVDDWLSENNLNHQYEPQIPNTRYKADFLVNGVYIEIWGIQGHEKYDSKKQRKLDIYQSLNLPLISLYRKHFPRLEPLYVLLKDAL